MARNALITRIKFLAFHLALANIQMARDSIILDFTKRSFVSLTFFEKLGIDIFVPFYLIKYLALLS